MIVFRAAEIGVQRNGVAQARATMCDWMATVAELLEPIVREMTRRVLASKVIGTDDTPVKVQDHQGQGVKTGHLWAYIGDRDHRFVVYDYTPNWSAEGPERFLKGKRSRSAVPFPWPLYPWSSHPRCY